MRGRGRGGNRGGGRGRGSDSSGMDPFLEVAESANEPATMEPAVASMFKQYQQTLDAKNDKFERILKAGRDVTIESKRIIFLLHRAPKNHEQSLSEAERRLTALTTTVWKERIARELQHEDHYQFLRAYYPGLQEFIEALALFHYLKDKTLVSMEIVRKTLDFSQENEDPPQSLWVLVPPYDFLMGLADLAGELMRLSVYCLSVGDIEAPEHVKKFMGSLHSSLVQMGTYCGHSKDFGGKIRVLRQSLSKVEDTCYTVGLRATEVPREMLAEVILKSMGAEPQNASQQQDYGLEEGAFALAF